MDWKRIKTILIIALIGINVILAYTIFEDQKSVDEEWLSRDLVVKLLETKQVTLDPVLLDQKTDIANVSLQLQTYDLEQSKETFEAASHFKDSSIELTTSLNGGKELSFETAFDRFDQPNLSDDDTLVLAYKLIEDLNISLEDIYLLDVGRTNKKTIITFGQKIGDYYLTDSYMVLKYNNQNLLEFKRVWYDVTDTIDVEKEFYKPEYALYEFVGALYERLPNRQRALTIEDIRLVYQIKPLTVEDELFDLVVKGEARIYWQITTSDKEAYLINAIIE